MKPIKLMTVKDLNTLRDMRVRARLLTSDAQLSITQQIGAFTHDAFAAEAVAKVLDEVNGRATTHTYGPSDIRTLVIDAEKRLAASGVTVANRPGTRVIAISAVPTSKAYARAARGAMATKVVLTRTTSAWVLTSAEKFERYAGPGGGEKITTEISEAAKADIVKSALDGFKVIEAKAPAVAA